MSRSLCASLAVLAALVAPALARADEGGPSTVEIALLRLGARPAPDAVRGLARSRLVAASPEAALHLVTILRGGGPAGTVGLAALARHDDPAVRVAALEALAGDGVRVMAATADVRACLRDAEPAVRRAAAAALGRVGGAGDVPGLLDAMSGDDAALARVARRAIVELAGLPSASVPSVIAYWWVEGRARTGAQIDAAASTLLDGRGEGREDARLVLSRSAWFDVEKVVETVRRCLRSADPQVRGAGYRIAAEARLGDVADEVESAFKYEFNEGLRPVAQATVAALGVWTGGADATPARTDAGVAIAHAAVGRPSDSLGSERGFGAGAAAPGLAEKVGPGERAAPASASGAFAADVGGPTSSERPLDARLLKVIDLLEGRRYDVAREILGAVADTGDEASRLAARKGFVAIYWRQRIDRADPPSATGLRDEARRIFRYTLWGPLFS